MAEAIVVAVILLLGLVGPFVLYYFVRAEREQGVVTDRETGERLARRDTDDDRRE